MNLALTSDFETEFMFSDKVTEYIRMGGDNFIQLLKLSLDKNLYNQILLKLERFTHTLLDDLKDSQTIYTKIDDVISAGITPIKVTLPDFSYEMKLPTCQILQDITDNRVVLSNDDIYCGSWKKINGKFKFDGEGTLKIKYIVVPRVTAKCQLTIQNGDEYTGIFSDGKFNGKGIYENKETKRHYEGDFINGQANGHGKFTMCNGNIYEGAFKNDIAWGFGKYIWKNGENFEGDFYDGTYVKGTYIYKSGNRYEGEFKNEKRHGKGILIFADGGHYEGDHENDQRHGFGIFKKCGNMYTGNFVNDKYSGKGDIIYADKSKYSGDFLNDCFHGDGTHTDTNGKCYEGKFDMNKYKGR